MILKQIKMSGFRGVKGEVTIPFGTAFTIITGRNGSGKSSICDAFEFALLGTIGRFSVGDVEGGERIENYVWWRNGSNADARRVSASFLLDDGSLGEWNATPKGTNKSFDERLFYSKPYPPDPLARLIQTALIRDESIVRFSTDLPEADRFDFFYKAIGVADLGKIEDRANKLVRVLREKATVLEAEYRTRREKVAQIIQQISEARIRTSRATNIDTDALQRKLLELTVSAPDTPLSQLALLARRKLADERQRVQALERLNTDLAQSTTWRERLASLQTTCEATGRKLQETESALRVAAQSRIEAGNQLRAAQSSSPLLVLLAQLIEYGSRVGPQNGHCPLCGLEISDSEFNSHLRQVQDEIGRHNDRLTALAKEEANRTAEYTELRARFQTETLEYNNELSELETLKSALQQLQKEAETLSIPLDAQSIDAALRTQRTRVNEFESTLSEFEASAALEQIVELEKQRNLAQNDAEFTSNQLNMVQRASQHAKIAADNTKRVSWEVVDDCLSELSPLLSELFVRLRPHIDYSEVKYRMRGDIKRFLSFEVGTDVNPRFTFSSGQRRALGLAFLLAVYLSRPWCNLRTLVLDDPVQHIDDYRALHLAEVLSSIRQLGHQLICTVEDPGLADLLCRRLRSASLGDGIRIELEYEPGIGSTVKAIEQLGPLPERILVPA